MKTGSKYIHTDGMRMELWIMTAWLADNHLLTCLTHSWSVCLPACLLLSTLIYLFYFYFFASLTSRLPCAHLCQYSCQSISDCVLCLYLGLTHFPSLSPFHIITCEKKSSLFFFVCLFSFLSIACVSHLLPSLAKLSNVIYSLFIGSSAA